MIRKYWNALGQIVDLHVSVPGASILGASKIMGKISRSLLIGSQGSREDGLMVESAVVDIVSGFLQAGTPAGATALWFQPGLDNEPGLP